MILTTGAAEDEALVRFILEFEVGCRIGLPLMKLNRWLGYIQGVLIERGITTVQIERDWTRPLFRHLDFPRVSRVTMLINYALRPFGFRLTKI
jgi:hypothetical protein